MLTLTVVVLGVFSLDRLATDLLPELIYPQIQVRVLDPGVSATIMEDRITRQLEEQLAITEDAVTVESESGEGASRVSLHFDYGKDIDIALRDASTRLDRAKRFLPTTIDPPIIYKSDPSQIPVMEFVVSSPLRDTVALRSWVDYEFSKRFISINGVAAVEIGGGLEREIHVLPDQRRLAGLGLSLDSLIQAIKKGNEDIPTGRLLMSRQEFSSRAAGRLTSVGAIAALPVPLATGESIPLSEVAQVIDTHEDERLRVRYNGVPGVKLSIQKQPKANTVEVADSVNARLAWLRANGLIPKDIRLDIVRDQSIYIRQSISNAIMAAVSGAILAMMVVYFFLGNIRGTLIIGSAIPISIMVAFIIMALGGLSFNIMTLGGLALGIGMLIDNTIVMLENISRHKQQRMARANVLTLDAAKKPMHEPKLTQQDAQQASLQAASEVNSAIVASTSTNLAAVLPFLFIGGLYGLLFRELIFTISAAIVGSLMVALTLVPSLSARARETERGSLHVKVDQMIGQAQGWYAGLLRWIMHHRLTILLVMFLILSLAAYFAFRGSNQDMLPSIDDGSISVSVTTDTGISLDEMDTTVQIIERLIRDQGEVAGIFTIVGGFIFGRTEREMPNRSTIKVQLVPLGERERSSEEWIEGFNKAFRAAQLAGLRVRTYGPRVSGLRVGRSDDDLSIRVEGTDLASLTRIGDEIVQRLRGIDGVRNIRHSAEEIRQEFAVKVDRERAAEFGVEISEIGSTMRLALEGLVVSDYLDNDRSHNIRVRLPRQEIDSPNAVGGILLFGESREHPAIYLRDVATVELVPTPVSIKRENQLRIIEINGSLDGSAPLGGVMTQVEQRLQDYALPPGYHRYSSGAEKDLAQGQSLARTLVGLALFLVFVVMAVQYESLRNPVIILLSIPFAMIGVSLGLLLTDMPVTMPVWLGLIMLVGIVVNNAIVLVEYIEILRRQGLSMYQAIFEAGRLRLRPILMTTITTVVGMLPLAIGLGEGSEMLSPLAVTIVSGLSFSLFVSLLLVPVIYSLVHRMEDTEQAEINLRPVA